MKISIFKIIFSLTLFFIVIRLSNIDLNDSFINVNNFTILLFTTLIGLIVISIRNHIIYNSNNQFKLKEVFIFTIHAWALSNFFFSGVSDLMKLFFFKKISKMQIFSFIMIEKYLNISILVLIIIIANFLLYLITKDYFFYLNIFYLIIFLLILFILFRNNFFLKFFPYFNILNYDFYSSKKLYDLKKYLKITSTIILIHFFSFTGFFLVLLYLNIKISALHIFILYFVNYLSGLFQIFPSGLGIREFFFYIVATAINAEVEPIVHLSLVFTTFNIFFSILILVLIKIFSRYKYI